MNLYDLAAEHGYAIEEVEVTLNDGESRPGWVVYDLASGLFNGDAINWTAEGLRDYIEEASGSSLPRARA